MSREILGGDPLEPESWSNRGRGRASSLWDGDVLLVDAEDSGGLFCALNIRAPHPERVARSQGQVGSSKLRCKRKEEMHRSGRAANPPQDNVSLGFLACASSQLGGVMEIERKKKMFVFIIVT